MTICSISLLRRSLLPTLLVAIVMGAAVPASCTITPAAMTSPIPGSKLSGSSVKFTWSSGSSMAAYYIWVGSTYNSHDIYGAGQGLDLSVTVSNMPTDGRTIYVKLSSKSTIGTWFTKFYTYTAAGTAAAVNCNSFSLGQNANLNDLPAFSTSSPWRQDISTAAVDPNSASIVNFIGATTGVHADFGAGTYNGSSLGIPYVVVDGTQKRVPVTVGYADEGDPGPMPIPANAPIEGYPNSNGDRHVLVIEKTHCWLYELYNAFPTSSGSWNVSAAAIWDLTGNEKRPYTWTAADAAGLPIFAGLIRYDEVASGEIKHAIRVTLQNSRQAFIPPASHWAPNSTNSLAAPMGMRLRLRANFDISKFSASNQVILKAMKRYGIIMADNGASMFIGGAPDERWNNDDLHLLGNVKASDFDVIAMNPVYTYTSVPTGPPPSISSFGASATTVTAGTPITLNWSVSGASYLIVTPVGPARGTSVPTTPQATTTYTLVATNQYGRTAKTVTVTVK